MDGGCGGKVKLVCYLTNALENHVKAIESSSELFILVASKGMLSIRLQLEKYQVTYSEFLMVVLVISLDLQLLLSLQQMHPEII